MKTMDKKVTENLKPFYAQRLQHIMEDEDPIGRVQRSAGCKIDDFLYEAGRYTSILRPTDPNATLCNIGSGTGLLNLVLGRFYREVVNIDPNPDFLETCKLICRNLPNMKYLLDGGQRLERHFPEPYFDDMIAVGVGGVLKRKEEFFEILTSCAKVVKRPGRIFICEVNDSNRKEAYLKSLPGILSKKGFSKERIAQIVADNADANWFSFDEYWGFFQKLGAQRATRIEGNLQHAGSEAQFDLLVQF